LDTTYRTFELYSSSEGNKALWMNAFQSIIDSLNPIK
jgi:hypothetical protein